MKTEAYDVFRHRIHSGARRDNVPLRVMFELTYRCNFKCAHCYVPASYEREYRERELATKDVFRVLDELKEMGCLYLGFTGGEPFMRRDIFDILEYARRCGFEVIVNTNGSLIDGKAADRLSLMGLNKVDITVPGMSEEVFALVTGVRGARDRVFTAIKLLRGRGIGLGLKTCGVDENSAEIAGIRRFARRIGVGHRLDDSPSPRLDGSVYPKGCVTKAALRRSAAKKSAVGALKRCGAGSSQCAITPAGELKACVMIDRPKFNIMDGSLRLAWLKQGGSIRDIKPAELCKCGLH